MMGMRDLTEFCRAVARAPAHPTPLRPGAPSGNCPKTSLWSLVGFVPTYCTTPSSCPVSILSLPPLFPCLPLSQDYSVTLLYD
jgi:hypothetical protein